jgi:hypothetical protein
LHAKRSPDEYRGDRNHLARSPSTTIQSANANDGIHIAQMQKLWGEGTRIGIVYDAAFCGLDSINVGAKPTIKQ